VMRNWFGSVVVAAVALTGCGKGLCTEYSDALESYVDNYGKVCKPGSQYTRPSDAALEQCDTDAQSFCTDEDRTFIQGISGCLEGLPACTSANKDAFDKDIQQCISEIESKSLSNDCLSISNGLFPH
jgi:hypothetical protein